MRPAGVARHFGESPGDLGIPEEGEALHPGVVRMERAAKNVDDDELKKGGTHGPRADLLRDELGYGALERLVQPIGFGKLLDDGRRQRVEQIHRRAVARIEIAADEDDLRFSLAGNDMLDRVLRHGNQKPVDRAQVLQSTMEALRLNAKWRIRRHDDQGVRFEFDRRASLDDQAPTAADVVVDAGCVDPAHLQTVALADQALGERHETHLKTPEESVEVWRRNAYGRSSHHCVPQ